MPLELIVLTTLPALNAATYGVREIGAEKFRREAEPIDVPLSLLTAPEGAALAAARAILLAHATTHATANDLLPEGAQVIVVTTKPELDEIEYGVKPAAAPGWLCHGVVIEIPLDELPEGDRDNILAARAAIHRLATLDAQNKGLLPL